MMEPSEFHQFVGRTFEFDDGTQLKIIQIKARQDGWWVTFEAVFSGSLPRRTVMAEQQFIQTYGHLFVG